MLTKMHRAAVKLLDEEKGEVEVILSDEAKDRDGDIIRQAGWDLADFKNHPVLVSSHDYFSLEKQIGEWTDVRVEGTQLIGTARYYTGAGNAEADWGFELARRGMAAYSVGFVPGQKRVMKDGGVEFVAGHKLLETSHVVIPANQNALQRMAAKAARGTLPEPLVSIMRDLTREPLPVSENSGAPARALPTTKWPYEDSYYQSHCIVMGCDDAAMLCPPICEEHLRYLVNAPAEPYPEESEEMVMEALTAATTRAALYLARNPAPETRTALAGVVRILMTETPSPVTGVAAPPVDGAAQAGSPATDPADEPASALPESQPEPIDLHAAGNAIGALLRRAFAERGVA